MGFHWLRIFFLIVGLRGAGAIAQDIGTEGILNIDDGISAFESQGTDYDYADPWGQTAKRPPASHYHKGPSDSVLKGYGDETLPVQVEETPTKAGDVEASGKKMASESKAITGQPAISGIKSLIWGITILLVSILQSAFLPVKVRTGDGHNAGIGLGLGLAISGLVALRASVRQGARGIGRGGTTRLGRGLALIILSLFLLLVTEPHVGQIPPIEEIAMGIFMAGLSLILGAATQRMEYFVQRKLTSVNFPGSEAPDRPDPVAEADRGREKASEPVTHVSQDTM